MKERQFKTPAGTWRVVITDDKGRVWTGTHAVRSKAREIATEQLRSPK